MSAKMGPIDHLGIAVRSIESAMSFWRDSLGLAVSDPEEVATEGVRVVFIPLGETRIELLEPLHADSPIARFIAKKGEGIHHVCVRVADIEAALARLEEKGMEIIQPAPRVGAGGRRIAFVHPKSSGGVLLELKEYAAGS